MVLDLDQAVIVALGSNLAGGLGSPEAVLEAALARFPEVGLKILKRSGWWRSAAWPDPHGPEYRNGVAIVEASLPPRAALGRTRSLRNAPRTLDLDLIAHGRAVLDEPGLVLPHPRAHERLFVMGPLAEIAPGWRHPIVGTTAAELAAAAEIGRDARPAAGSRDRLLNRE
jgi:2-amino-4-hydroxy-6-hydroxymethyldihydropteridine diphosphokinase